MAKSIHALNGKIGAYAQQARHDTRETTKAARLAFNARWEDQVDPERVLTVQERGRRAEAARKEHYARMGRASAKRRKKAGLLEGATNGLATADAGSAPLAVPSKRLAESK